MASSALRLVTKGAVGGQEGASEGGDARAIGERERRRPASGASLIEGETGGRQTTVQIERIGFE